ncbi:MAG: hypothetical protein Unbinned400contig1000_20 [Prokaryotic dsDNA virus sp.]|nr:MAG: hypothetical protein Unbinned400contig1000_20 [Prokaryotic dsDNA virus sp.]
MSNFSEIFERAKAFVDAKDVTVAQIEAASAVQIGTVLEIPVEDLNQFADRIDQFKKKLKSYAQKREDIAMIQTIKRKLAAEEFQWLKDNIRFVDKQINPVVAEVPSG